MQKIIKYGLTLWLHTIIIPLSATEDTLTKTLQQDYPSYLEFLQAADTSVNPDDYLTMHCLSSTEHDPSIQFFMQQCEYIIEYKLKIQAQEMMIKRGGPDDYVQKMVKDMKSMQEQLFQAILSNNFAQMSQLLTNHPDQVNANQPINYITPIEQAISCGSLPALQILIGHGATLNKKDHFEKSKNYIILLENRGMPASEQIHRERQQDIRRYEEVRNYIRDYNPNNSTQPTQSMPRPPIFDAITIPLTKSCIVHPAAAGGAPTSRIHTNAASKESVL